MSYEVNWELIAKYLSGESTPDENSTVENWLDESEENRKLFDSMKKVWETPEDNYEPSDIKALWENVAERSGINTESTAAAVFDHHTGENIFSKFSDLYNKPLFRYAAVFLLAVSTMLIYFIVSTGVEDDEWISVIVKNGEAELINLVDGSRIYADAGSTVEYPEDYGLESRQVKLYGEAYFMVDHDPDKPFIVYSGNAVIEVLGTRFNVRTWKESEYVKVAVVDGKVSLGSAVTKNLIVLEKGEGSSLGKDGNIEQVYDIKSRNVMAWSKGEIYFEDTRLQEILAQLERWYDIKIHLSDNSINSEKLSVKINNKSLPENLDILSRLTSTSYSINENIVTLTSGN